MENWAMDDLLMRRLRNLDTTVAPDPAFAEALFATLTARRRAGARTGLDRFVGVAAAGAAAVVVLAIGVAVLGNGLVGPVATNPPSPSPSLTPPASATPIGRPAAPEWEIWSQAWEGEVASVTEWEGSLFAVGNSRGTDSRQGEPNSGAVWTSTDGLAWVDVDIPDEMSRSMLAAAYVGKAGQLVLLGATASSQSSLAWTSLDGRTWSANDAPAVSAPIVVGRAGAYLMLDLATSAVWTSADGLSWATLDAAFIDSSSHVVDVAVGDNRRVIVSCARNPEANAWQRDCRTWTTTDGATWQMSEVLPGQSVRVAWFGGSWVAAGWAADVSGSEGVIQLWQSADGLVWTPASQITEGFVNPYVDRLFPAGDHLILKAGDTYTRSFVCDGSLQCQPLGIEIITMGAASLGDVVTVVGNNKVSPSGVIWSWDTSAAPD
jgi:hypothetical protein